MENIYPAVLLRIKPNSKEKQHVASVAKAFLSTLNKNLRKAHAILGGSGAKGTWLSGNHDIDIFVQYEYKTFKSKSKELSNLLEPILRKSFPKQKIERLHGSRDYFRFSYNNLNFEVVPILKISKAEQAVNITDVSPLHARWVNKHTKNTKDDILLAKQFLKANNMYGAESHIGGLSGYGVEILIAYYGSFDKFLQAATRWDSKEIIDIAKHYTTKDPTFELNQSKLQSPLILIDPVDKFRNAAAAFTVEKFLLLKKKAREYLTKLDSSFFEKRFIPLSALEAEAAKKKTNLLYIAVLPLTGKEDVVGGKLLKAFQFLQEKLAPYSITSAHWDWPSPSEARFYFFLRMKELPVTEIRQGPPLKMESFVKDFRKKYKDTFMENNHIMAKVKTSHPQLKERVSLLLQEKYVTERIKKVKEVKNF